MSTTLTRAQKRARAQIAARRFHPTFHPRVRPGSPIARVIESRAARHTQTVAAIHRVASAPRMNDTERLLWIFFGPDAPANRDLGDLACEDCQRAVMDTHACDVKPHTLCLDCCGCPEHQA